MAAPRTKPPWVLTPEDRAWLERLAHSRTAPRQAVERAQILVAYADGGSVWAIHRTTGFSTRKVRRCVDLALEAGPQAALAAHIRQTAEAEGHLAAARWSPGTVAKLLKAHALHPHRVPYDLERRDPDCDAQMVRVLHVSQPVAFAFDGERPTFRLSYDEKPGIPAIGTTAPDRPPQPGGPAGAWQRDPEDVRHGTVSLLAGIDWATGAVIGVVRDRHRSRELVAFLQALDAQDDSGAKIPIVRDPHSAHPSRETQAYWVTRPHRFARVFTPKHGSWLHLLEGFFAKLRTVFLRHLRVQSQGRISHAAGAIPDGDPRAPRPLPLAV